MRLKKNANELDYRLSNFSVFSFLVFYNELKAL